MDEKRKLWREFICSSESAGRFLSGISKQSQPSTGRLLERHVIRDFLERLSNSERDPQILADAIDLLSGEYVAFFGRTIERLLPALSHEAKREKQVVGPALRGAPVWHETVLRRRAGAIGPAEFVVRQPTRSYDLPENVLIRWLCENIVHAVANLANRMGSDALHPELRNLRQAAEKALKHTAMRDLPHSKALTPEMKTRARLNKNRVYSEACVLAEQREALSRRNQEAYWLAVLRLLQANWLEPIDINKLFELYTLVMVMDVLEKELGYGPPHQYGLVMRARSHVALFKSGDDEVYVYFNQTMSCAGLPVSRYKRVINEYANASGAERRPDIVLVCRSQEVTKSIGIIDAKNASSDDYVRESIYKAFAYSYDYSEILGGEGRTSVVLVFPNDLRQKRSYSDMNFSDVILASTECRPALIDAVRRLCVASTAA